LKDGPGSVNVPVTIGGILVYPGDVILGDSDGIIALRPNIALEAAKLGKEKELAERKAIESIHAGNYDDAWVDIALVQTGAL
jgi:regulator of RNase E activity RraA